MTAHCFGRMSSTTSLRSASTASNTPAGSGPETSNSLPHRASPDRANTDQHRDVPSYRRAGTEKFPRLSRPDDGHLGRRYATIGAACRGRGADLSRHRRGRIAATPGWRPMGRWRLARQTCRRSRSSTRPMACPHLAGPTRHRAGADADVLVLLRGSRVDLGRCTDRSRCSCVGCCAIPSPAGRVGPTPPYPERTMDISTKTDYAIRALVALARRPDEVDDRRDRVGGLGRLPPPQRQGCRASSSGDPVRPAARRARHEHARAHGGIGWRVRRTETPLGECSRVVDGPLAEVRRLRPQDLAYAGSAEHLPTVWVAVRSACGESSTR